ncbi:chemotaxis-specific protein-glutamate methyltransferase CheB [Hyalangium versicolor]|uniref:chemotaxis-specific protein-glutamate methyltransferase CheB n=1 Tax=Hyalangium versicolor TaxID=2861190 RepID=UPI001CCBE2F5|nr:chemotaxis-specific protein-glutamate methyltransferase CheB [Hyalangium versicolor]
MPPIRILVADSSAVARRELSHMLGSDPTLEVVATAPTGKQALEQVEHLRPEIVVLELSLQDMSGLDVLKALRRQFPRLPVLIFSALAASTGTLTLDALAHGASDYITKPTAAGGVPHLDQAREQLVTKIKELHSRIQPEPPKFPPPRKRYELAKAPERQPRLSVVVIGASTGGPNMLSEVIATLPADFPVPVLIAQHMPPVFTKLFAERLDSLSPLQVREALAGEQLKAGQVWVAPGDYHLAVTREGPVVKLVTHRGPMENSCRPAADVLFRSAAAAYGAGVLAVVMTGMGQDGLKGCQVVSQAGGRIMVQDPLTCVVGSMPQSVLQAGIAHQVVPLKSLGAEIVRRVNKTLSAEHMTG